MPTANIATGVLERNSPLSLQSNVVWRAIVTLANGASILTPLFDVVEDGNSYDELEVGGLATVRIPTPEVYIAVATAAATSLRSGGIIRVIECLDIGPGFSGGLVDAAVYYAQTNGGSGFGLLGQGLKVFRHRILGRRCIFFFQNRGLGPSAGGTNQFRCEVSIGGAPDA